MTRRGLHFITSNIYQGICICIKLVNGKGRLMVGGGDWVALLIQLMHAIVMRLLTLPLAPLHQRHETAFPKKM